MIGAAVGKAELAEQMAESFRRKEAMVKETGRAFRNRISAIGTISQRIARLARNTDLSKEAMMPYREVELLETHAERFEKYIGI